MVANSCRKQNTILVFALCTHIFKNRQTLYKLVLHDTICLTDSVVFTPSYCVNFKEIRDESTSFNRIVVDKSHRATIATGQLFPSDRHLHIAPKFSLWKYTCIYWDSPFSFDASFVHICWSHGSSFKGFSVVFPAP